MLIDPDYEFDQRIFETLGPFAGPALEKQTRKRHNQKEIFLGALSENIIARINNGSVVRDICCIGDPEHAIKEQIESSGRFEGGCHT